MARINIEDSLFTKRAWMRLLMLTQDEDKALGSLVRAIIIAQRYWFPDKKKIPRDVWDEENLNNQLIECGLAVETDGGIYIRGSEDAFDWLFKKSKAGKKSGEARRQNSEGHDDTNADEHRSTPLNADEHSSTTVNDCQQPSTSSSSSFSISSSFSSSGSSSDSFPLKPPQEVGPDMDFVSAVRDYPRPTDKSKGIARAEKYIKREDFPNFKTAVANYARSCAIKQRDLEHIKHLASFVGSKRSGHPWEYWINPDPREFEPVASKQLGLMPRPRSANEHHERELEALERREAEREVGT